MNSLTIQDIPMVGGQYKNARGETVEVVQIHGHMREWVEYRYLGIVGTHGKTVTDFVKTWRAA